MLAGLRQNSPPSRGIDGWIYRRLSFLQFLSAYKGQKFSFNVNPENGGSKWWKAH
jgi:hypothetical protein